MKPKWILLKDSNLTYNLKFLKKISSSNSQVQLKKRWKILFYGPFNFTEEHYLILVAVGDLFSIVAPFECSFHTFRLIFNVCFGRKTWDITFWSPFFLFGSVFWVVSGWNVFSEFVGKTRFFLALNWNFFIIFFGTGDEILDLSEWPRLCNTLVKGLSLHTCLYAVT